MAKEGGWHAAVPTDSVREVREFEGEVRHRSRTCVRQLKASAVRIFWRVRPALAFCPVRDAHSQSASAASLGLDRKDEGQRVAKRSKSGAPSASRHPPPAWGLACERSQRISMGIEVER